MKRKQRPSLILLRQLYNYNHKTGEFFHQRDTARGRNGKQAGFIRADGYWSISINGTTYLGHHVAWYHYYGWWPQEVDHKDRNRSNNKIDNLRDATRTQNNGNSNGWGDKKKSKLPRGVFYHPADKTRFRAQIFVNYKAIHLGCFETINGAMKAYKQAAEQHFGEFAK